MQLITSDPLKLSECQPQQQQQQQQTFHLQVSISISVNNGKLKMGIICTSVAKWHCFLSHSLTHTLIHSFTSTHNTTNNYPSPTERTNEE